MNQFLCLVGVLSLNLYAFAAGPSLDSLMSDNDQKKTGYSTLSLEQKKALNEWINAHFALNIGGDQDSLSLSVNMQNGKVLVLSDGSKWEIAPDDQTISSLWITPFPLLIQSNDSSEYPNFIFNLQTKEKVKARPYVQKVPNSQT